MAVVALATGIAVSCAMPTHKCDTVVSLVTFFPGSDIYELEGHTALRVTTPDFDDAVSYGMFDFNSPNFVYRFVKGETDYSVGVIPWAVFLNAYTRDGRRVVEQELDLTSAEKQRLMELLTENIRPENRVYRYNYVKDNCATRPLAIVERALGDTIALTDATDPRVAGSQTFRSMMRRYHENYPWYQLGIDLALGSGLDAPISVRDKAFAPVVLCQQMENATVGGRKIVKATYVDNDVDEFAAVEQPTPWYISPTFVAWFLLALTVAICITAIRRKRFVRWFATTLFAINGIEGLVITFLVFVSVHEATSPNWLILWLNPLCFVPCVTMWFKRLDNVTRIYFACNAVLTTALVLYLNVGPCDANPAFYPLILADIFVSATYLLTHPKGSR